MFIGSADDELLNEYKEDFDSLAKQLNLNLNCDFDRNLEEIGLKKSIICGERDVISYAKGRFVDVLF